MASGKRRAASSIKHTVWFGEEEEEGEEMKDGMETGRDEAETGREELDEAERVKDEKLVILTEEWQLQGR